MRRYIWTAFLTLGCSTTYHSQPTSVQEAPAVISNEPSQAIEALPKPIEAAPEPKVEVVEPELEAPWTWPLKSNHGMRVDSGGAGWFGAKRGSSRKHGGIDLIADIDTPVVAVCDGQFRTKTKNPYGNYVQLVCLLPFESSITSVSILYGHLSGFNKEAPEYIDVKAGEVVGYVGKSGNAGGSDIMSHLHIEMLVHNEINAAKSEEHRLHVRSPVQDYKVLSNELSQCLHGFKPGPRGFNNGHKFDPFLLLACLANRPAIEETNMVEIGSSFSTYYKSLGLSRKQSALITKEN